VLKHAADLRRRDPLLQSEILDELVAAVGRPGQIYLTNAKPRHDWPLPPLPEGAQVLVLTGPEAVHALRAYDAHACRGSPDVSAGPEAGVVRGWAAPQQHLALEGTPIGSRKVCNAVVLVRISGEPAGVLSMHLDPAHARSCVVQAIHVMLSWRGPFELSRHLWQQARTWVTETARAKGCSHVRFSLETSCGQSQQACHFWIGRMGWDGTQDAKRAARGYSSGVVQKVQVGVYECFFDLRI
jgi:hypothetical protein